MQGQMFEVGKRYPGEGWRFPMPEVTQYNYDVAGHVLQLFWPGATGREVKAVRKGDARFALAVEGPAIFLCYRFGEMPWSDCPFTIHLLPEDRWPSTGLDAETGAPRNMLDVRLVDARSGVLRAIRLFGLHRGFTDAFEVALREQIAAGWGGREDYDAALADVYRRYPHSSDLARAAVARSDFPRTVGG